MCAMCAVNFTQHFVLQCGASRDADCACDDEKRAYSTPVRYKFSSSSRKPTKSLLSSIKQRKGEAELAQLDHLVEIVPSLNNNEYVLSLYEFITLLIMFLASFRFDTLIQCYQPDNHIYKRFCTRSFIE